MQILIIMYIEDNMFRIMCQKMYVKSKNNVNELFHFRCEWEN